MNVSRAWPLLVLLLSGCPGNSQPGGEAPTPPAGDAATPDAELATQVCFQCDEEFSGASQPTVLRDLPLCSPPCREQLVERVREAEEAGQRICFQCGDAVAEGDVAFYGPKTFCGEGCREAFQDAEPKPACRSCGEEVSGSGSYFEASKDWGESADMRFCDEECADAWTEQMNSRE